MSLPSRGRGLQILVVAALLIGAGWLVWRQVYPAAEPAGQGASQGGRRGARGRPGQGEPVSVLVAPARYADVPVVLEAVGTAQPLNTVTVRSQVDGRLLELAFREGQDIRKGEVLARIDPTIYQAQYDQAVAKKMQDEANLANARLDLTRYQNLAQTNYGSKQQADTQRAAVAQLEAQVKSDQGAVDNARAYLDYTTIRSPIDGRIGIRLVDTGNLVRAADTTGLVVITQLRPINVVFSLPQQNLRAVNAAMAKAALAVEALEADNRSALDQGRLEVVDNQVDQTTGTVKLKAVFPNGQLQLWPGSFVNVRLTVDTLKGVVTVPTGAVQRGPNGAFVYGLEGDKAVLKPVTVLRETEQVAALASGVTPPEPVITTGFARLTEGDRVRPTEATPAASDTPAAQPSRRRPEGGEGGRRRRPDGSAEVPASPPGQADSRVPLRQTQSGGEGVPEGERAGAPRDGGRRARGDPASGRPAATGSTTP